MPIELTPEQWESAQQGSELPIRVNSPANGSGFVLLPAEVYERWKAVFEADPVTPSEREFQLRQFGKRAGWDDPEMDIYDDLDPRHKS
ncbi:hypothetical protein NA78x_001503 [Anatilimnocola sp. NA78]|uniref:hypothetical protein n=1 Tax=Anatilimnocola sp. NA78 TaxID=3415683 RepID=UPI003CE591CF